MKFRMTLLVEVDEPCPDADCADTIGLMEANAPIGGREYEIHVGDLIDLLQVPGGVTLEAYEALP